MTKENKRQSRNNHAVADQYPITDAVSAQRFCDQAIEATKNDKPSTMYNSSGFVTPTSLDNQDIDNLLRMASHVINNLANRIDSQDDGGEAIKALDVLIAYAKEVVTIKQRNREERILRQADEIRRAQASSK